MDPNPNTRLSVKDALNSKWLKTDFELMRSDRTGAPKIFLKRSSIISHNYLPEANDDDQISIDLDESLETYSHSIIMKNPFIEDIYENIKSRIPEGQAKDYK